LTGEFEAIAQVLSGPGIFEGDTPRRNRLMSDVLHAQGYGVTPVEGLRALIGKDSSPR